MGWKNIKEAYGIGHLVCVTEEGICIGSAYIHDIIVIGMDGVIKKRYEKDGWGHNVDLLRYMEKLDSDKKKVIKLISDPDTFEISNRVYTYDGANILEYLCEEFEWPNVTHCGQLMYNNTFSPDRNTVIEWARINASSGVELYTNDVESKKELLKSSNARLIECKNDLQKLESMG